MLLGLCESVNPCVWQYPRCVGKLRVVLFDVAVAVAGAVVAVVLLLVEVLFCFVRSSTVFCNLLCASNRLTRVSLGVMAALAEW